MELELPRKSQPLDLGYAFQKKRIIKGHETGTVMGVCGRTEVTGTAIAVGSILG